MSTRIVWPVLILQCMSCSWIWKVKESQDCFATYFYDWWELCGKLVCFSLHNNKIILVPALFCRIFIFFMHFCKIPRKLFKGAPNPATQDHSHIVWSSIEIGEYKVSYCMSCVIQLAHSSSVMCSALFPFQAGKRFVTSLSVTYSVTINSS